MTLEQLSKVNEKFQQRAASLAELLPGGKLLPFSAAMSRSAQKIDVHLKKILSAKSEQSFFMQIDRMEEEMDELTFLMDRLDEANRKQKIRVITEAAMKGYDLVALYASCCDQILERKSRAQKEF